MEKRKSYNNISVITDGSYRAVQAHELAKELAKLGVDGEVQISCGLDVVKQAAASKNVFKVNILDPQQYYDDFDLIVISSHEPHPAHDNIIEITGLINHISPEYLKGKEHDFGYGRKVLAVLVGGKHVGGNFSVDDAAKMASQLNDINMPVLVTTSKRTEEASARTLQQNLKVPCRFYNFNFHGQAANPYEQFLASAGQVFVTADSVRMVSEAASSGKELFIFMPEQVHFSYVTLAEKVMSANLPLRESVRVAEIIRNKINSGLQK